MKSLFSTVVLAFVAVAAFAQQTAEYNIKGTCAADVKKVYIVNPMARGNQALCDSAVVEAGKFALRAPHRRTPCCASTPRTLPMPCLSSTTAHPSQPTW